MIRRELVFVNSDCKSRDEVIDVIASKAKELGLIEDVKMYKDAVIERENIFSTAIGYEVAIPHGVSSTIKDAFIGFMKTKEKFVWGGNDNTVDLIFMIGVPDQSRNKLHLKFIASISKNLMKEEFRQALENCKDADEAYDFLNKINADIEKEVKE